MSNPSISLVHQINPSNAQNAALAFAEANLLKEVITPIAYDPNAPVWRSLNWVPKKLKLSINNELSRRTWVSSQGFSIQNYPLQEIIRILLSRTRLAPRLGFSYGDLVHWVYLCLDRQVAKHHIQGLNAIYTYEDLAATTFQEAKQQGILCLYDLPIPFYRMTSNIMRQEAENFPEIAPAIESIQEPAWKIERKEQEVKLADHIFVASSVTKNSLLEIGVEPEKISVIPYGGPIDYFQPQPKTDDCFRALFVGRVSPRKGVHYLLQAWQELRLYNAELVFVGTNMFPAGWFEQYQDIYRHVPSVPHPLLNQYYSSASVLVFPSLVEGFGLVLLEAMACGIPVITTPNTAGPDILTDGVEGFIVPIRDVEALKEKLEWCHTHPVELAEMGRAARRKAEQLNWGLYRQRLATQVRSLLKV
ncbi:glycosyltransferase family 4 protein [Nostoc sp. 106C]|uniref:glycosyltransferase family 4 protein n=1 Tax=Nostoc sp. 106C TaxID=1932667 RepID=UPI000A3BE6CE|nr:glycosyltransferase family 4 protein [Nostoc sp. 106C]OUL30814.1 glycosyl transferase family 1 [Nostoc sp. 106C]